MWILKTDHPGRILSLCFVLLLGLTSISPALASDPVISDPAIDDADYPAAMAEIALDSHGSRLNAILYQAQGEGPHPTVVLLHGFPGNERNLDLAQAIRRSGFNVLFFNYRGSWGSEGTFSFGGCLEDVSAALDWLRNKEMADEYRVDSKQISLVGHSMGGFLALVTSARDASVRCTASIAGFNFGLLVPMARSHEEAAEAIALALQKSTGPLHGTSGQSLLDELLADSASFDLLARAEALQGRSLLLVGGYRDRVAPLDSHHRPLVQALMESDAADLTEIVLDADHPFSSKRIALSRILASWLARSCK